MDSNQSYRLCKLYTFGNDTSKNWTLEFYQFNIKTGKKQRRFFAGFNKSKDPNKRLIEAKKWEKLINTHLQAGAVYDPDDTKQPKNHQTEKVSTFIADLDNYLVYQKSFLADTSYKSYRAFVDKWKEFSKVKSIQNLSALHINPAICNGFIDYLLTLSINNTTRNNTIARLKSACNFFTEPGRERWIVSPARHIKEFPASSESHEPFTDKQAESVLKAICERQDYQLLLFIYFIYYTFARPGKEARLLKVGDLRERSVVFRSKYSKTNLTKSPTLSKALEKLIDEMGIRQENPDYYVFGKGGKPGSVPVAMNYFYNRHRDILKDLNITGKHTLYSWKHTGNIKLFRSSVNLKSIQLQNGHTSLRTTETYLRELGTFVDNDIYEKFM